MLRSYVRRKGDVLYASAPLALCKWICGSREGDVRRQSIAHPDDDASWRLHG
jgi:hypothetical protein